MTTSNRPIAQALIAPFERLFEAPLYAKLLATVSGALSILQSDILTLILIALMGASIWDTIVGRAAAKKRGEMVDAQTARAGFLTKVTGLVLVLLIRFFEYWGEANEIPGLGALNGSLAAGVSVALFVMELESIEGHRVSLGARPIPGFSALIRVMRAIEGRLLVVTNPTAPPTQSEEES